MIKDICGPSVIQFFVISTLLAYTNAYVVRCRRTPRDDGRFGFCKSEGKSNTNTYTNPAKLSDGGPRKLYRDLLREIRGLITRFITIQTEFKKEQDILSTKHYITPPNKEIKGVLVFGLHLGFCEN